MMFYQAKIEFLQQQIHNDREEIGRLTAHIWRLEGRLQRLLDHFGLHEVTKPAETVIRTKGGPEEAV